MQQTSTPKDLLLLRVLPPSPQLPSNPKRNYVSSQKMAFKVREQCQQGMSEQRPPLPTKQVQIYFYNLMREEEKVHGLLDLKSTAQESNNSAYSRQEQNRRLLLRGRGA